MRTWYTTLTVGVFATLLAGVVSSQAQQVTVGNRFNSLSDSFFENNSINWNGHYKGISFSFGGPGLSTPQFGSPQTGAGLSTQFAIAGKDGQINFYTTFGQGYRQSFATQAPSVTLTNGQTGFVSDTSQTPFVVSVVPVVGAFPVAPQFPPPPAIEPDAVDPRIQAMAQAHADAQAQQAAQAQGGGPVQPQQQRPNNPAPQPNVKPVKAPDPLPDPAAAAGQRLGAAQASTAGRPALSVAEAKRLHQQEQTAANGEMAALMERARALEEDGQPNVAKIYYQRIAKHASGELQQQARARLYDLQGSK